MDYLSYLMHAITHLDDHIVSLVTHYGVWAYLVLFLVIFCETGLIVTPFLPGDSLLFTLGSIAAQTQSSLNIIALLLLLTFAATLGNVINYTIGRFVGPRVFAVDKNWLINRKHLTKAHEFYEQYGGKTIIFARFIPIIRTFAPFVAGISYMRQGPFHTYNVISAILWVGSLLGMGYFLGSLPIIQAHFSIVIYGVILASLLPALWSILKHIREGKNDP